MGHRLNPGESGFMGDPGREPKMFYVEQFLFDFKKG